MLKDRFSPFTPETNLSHYIPPDIKKPGKLRPQIRLAILGEPNDFPPQVAEEIRSRFNLLQEISDESLSRQGQALSAIIVRGKTIKQLAQSLGISDQITKGIVDKGYTHIIQGFHASMPQARQIHKRPSK